MSLSASVGAAFAMASEAASSECFAVDINVVQTLGRLNAYLSYQRKPPLNQTVISNGMSSQLDARSENAHVLEGLACRKRVDGRSG